MIISHKYKFIFIKTLKTAGTSIEIFLSQHCGEDDIVTPIYPHVEPHVARNYRGVWNPLPEIIENSSYRTTSILKEVLKRNKFYNHISAREVKARISKNIWNNYFKFCIERNPWDKTISYYHMLNYRAGGNITFARYIDMGDFCLNYPLYTDASSNLMIDKVIKYESLTEELQKIFNNLGIPFNGNLGTQAKSEYRQNKKPYQEVFTDEQRKIIEEAFSKEIQMHGYKYC